MKAAFSSSKKFSNTCWQYFINLEYSLLLLFHLSTANIIHKGPSLIVRNFKTFTLVLQSLSFLWHFLHLFFASIPKLRSQQVFLEDLLLLYRRTYEYNQGLPAKSKFLPAVLVRTYSSFSPNLEKYLFYVYNTLHGDFCFY